MEYEYTNPRFADPLGKSVNLTIDHPDHGPVPFTATQEDYPEIWDAIIASGPAPYIPPSDEELAAEARAHRDRLLTTEVDPIVTNPLRWADMPEDEKAAYIAYRDRLLDVPEQPDFPRYINWPVLGEF